MSEKIGNCEINHGRPSNSNLTSLTSVYLGGQDKMHQM